MVVNTTKVEVHTEVMVEAEVLGEVFRILKTMIRIRIVIEVVPGVETVVVPAAEVPTAVDIPGGI